MSSDSQPTCYAPNRVAYTSKDYIYACNTSAEHSACCPKESVCMSNGLCLQTGSSNGSYNNRLARWGCTDSTWESSACPQYCQDVSTTNSVSVLPINNNPTGQFCCNPSAKFDFNTTTQQCDTATSGSTEPFYLDIAQVIYDRSTGAIITTGSADIANTSTASSTESSTASTASDSSNVAPVATGLGVSLGVAFLAALAAAIVFFRQNRNLRKQLREARERPYQDQGKAALSHPLSQSDYQHNIFANPAELDADRKPEMSGHSISEVPGSPFRA